MNKGGRPKGSRDVAGKIRWGLIKALENIESKSGRTLADLIEAEIEDKGVVEVAKALSCYSPKSLDITQTNLTPEDWLELMSDAASKSESTEPENTVQGQLH